jgi:hypothetical protein
MMRRWLGRLKGTTSRFVNNQAENRINGTCLPAGRSKSRFVNRQKCMVILNHDTRLPTTCTTFRCRLYVGRKILEVV